MRDGFGQLWCKIGEKKKETFSASNPLFPLLFPGEGAGDEFRLKNITQLESQNSSGAALRAALNTINF
jgi:hypothetical protein